MREAARGCPRIELSNLPLYPGFDSADTKGVFRLAAILLSSLWLSGCFVAEEIRKGDALIEQHSVGWRNKKERVEQAEEEVAKAEAEAENNQARNTGPDTKSKLSKWLRETIEEEPVKADPSDKIVSCTIGGKLQFLRKSDCEIRRGQTTELKTKDKSAQTAPSRPRPGA